MFSGEFHESVVDLRIASCTVGLDLVWARRYRSRLARPAGQTPLGQGWDHSYNIYGEFHDDQTVTIHDGNARPASFTRGDRGWTAPMYHRSGDYDPEGRFIMAFADGGTWTFRSAEESVDASLRRLARVTDRNANIIELEYDESDRLARVINAVGQSFELEYDANNRITSVVAQLDTQTSRRITYDYDGDDLHEVTLPAVVDTVTNNDFPAGTTTVYTYSKGSSAPELDGNLLTIEDGLGRVYLRNEYASTSNPLDLEFDRLVRQTWGAPDDVIAISYARVEPSPDNSFAVTKAWSNDRVGRVSEHFFDDDNQLVILREYSGFAEPGIEVTETENRPTGKLRPMDPTYFETRYEYNVDGHVTRLVQPRGNMTVSIYEGDLDSNAPPRIRGNLRETRREGGLCGSEFVPIRETYEYAAGFGNEHGERDFVVRATSPRGDVTTAAYDERGNRTSVAHPEPGVREDMEYSEVGQLTRHVFPTDQHGHRRETTCDFSEDGRLRERVEDPQGLALTTRYEYDAACNEVRRIDPRGFDKLYTYNERDLVIREEGPLVECSNVCGGGIPTRSRTDRIYDANMNLVRVDQHAFDCDGTPQSDDIVSTTFVYDILGELVSTKVEVGEEHDILDRFDLDANREVVAILHGLAASGVDPFNMTRMVYDERGLLFREIRAEGSAIAATTEHRYDANGNTVRTLEGLEGPLRVTEHEYDCADRHVATVDPMGNRTQLDLDPAGNVIEHRLFGELVDLPGILANVLLERTSTKFDSMNRPVEVSRGHFDPRTQAPLGDGESTTRFTYDGESRIVRRVDDEGNETLHDFDRAGRRVATVDPEGNVERLEYDASGNITTRRMTDVAPDAEQVGVWTHAYDARNSLTQSTDPMGGSSHRCQDSLGRMTDTVDMLGNRTKHVYDLAGRLVETAQLMTDDGTGAGVVVGQVTTRQVWDDSDRLVAREDPNGNVTTYEYDSLNRLTAEVFAIGSRTVYGYDAHDDLIYQEDTNGTILTTIFDSLGRPTQVDVQPGPGVDASTTFESFAWEGRSLLTSAMDDDSEVTRAHDSLGALLAETQAHSLAPAPYTLGHVRDGLGNAKETTYPGGRHVQRSFDGLGRTRAIHENGELLAEFDHLGPNILRRDFAAADLQSEFQYDLARRATSVTHLEGGKSVLERREFGYDVAGNKVSEAGANTGSPAGLRTAVHDSLGRLVSSEVTGSAGVDRVVEYELDDSGNRQSVSGDECPGVYEQSGDGAGIHQYAETPCFVQSYDAAGNVVESAGKALADVDRSFVYDHRGRLVHVAIPALGQIDFAYDALGRKISSVGFGGSQSFVYDDWNVLEEYVDGELEATYLFGDGLDDRLARTAGDTTWWYLTDDLGSTLALAARGPDDSLLVERTLYHDYGRPSPTVSPSGNAYLFAGSRWLPEAGLYDLRTRHFDPVVGRFISRDTLGTWADEENLGNGYTYVANAPDMYTDPTGESQKPNIKNCSSDARGIIEDTLELAEQMGREAMNWFDGQADRKRKHRKGDWNGQKNDGRAWWGKYNNTRFHRIKWNFRKIVRRCSENVITFKCRSTGELCGYGKAVAWTLSSWHAWIRLCRNSQKGFFQYSGALYGGYLERGSTIMHEVSHNINAIGEKTLNGMEMSSVDQVQRLATKNPLRASWNAFNYQRYALAHCTQCKEPQ